MIRTKKIVKTGCLLAMTLAMPYWGLAAPIFEADFDSAPYDTSSSFGVLPTGAGVLTYGSWTNFSSGQAWALTTNEQSYSPSYSLILDRLGTSGAGNAQVLGMFGYDNSPEPIDSAISFSMAFRVTNNSIDNLAAISFRDTLDQNVAYAYLGMDGKLQIPSGPAGPLVTVGSIAVDQWYVMEVFLPSATGTQYTFNLYDSDGVTPLGSQTVEALKSPVGGYWYFTAGSALDDSAVYLDNISAQAVPEPGALGLCAIGVLFCGAARRKRRNLAE